MAAPDIEDKYLKAGREFASALDALGLDANALFWAFDSAESRHVLVLVTDFFDFKGPLEISKQLFKAYNASATPKEIDPFVIRLHSINQAMGERYSEHASSDWKLRVRAGNKAGPIPGLTSAVINNLTIGDLEMRPEWVIRGRKVTRSKSNDLSRRWGRFTRNVEKAAA
ncbi:hypothetical protein ACQZ6F_17430 [Rhizobium sp. A22-96]